MARIKKYNYLIIYYLILNVARVFCGSEGKHLCCQANQYVVRNRTFSYCYEPKVNVTTPVNLECVNSTVVITKSQINYSVNSDSQLILRYKGLETEHENGKYCLGTLMNLKNHSKQTPAAVLCQEEEIKVIGQEAIGYCMMISCIFLSVTAIIYVVLPELRDLQGMSIINLCVSLALGFGVLALMKLMTYSDMTLCAVRGFLAYFFILAAFFWMNVISIQIMLKLRSPTISSYKCKEFAYYATYAWGVPALLTAVVAIVNYTPGDHIRPGIGLSDCWFFNTKQQWHYMYSVMTILIVTNICIFGYTSVLLWKNTFNSKHYKIVRYKFAMTLRLALVMGVSWIFEMLGTVSSHVIWEILDIINALQGVFIFLVVVVLRRRVVQAMYRRGWLRCVAGPVERCLAVGDNDEDEPEHTTLGIQLD